jgi:hypothetical protein
MILAILALLGVPLWLLLGALGASLWNRRQFKRRPGVFQVKLRTRSTEGEQPRWGRRTSYAVWVHDVLLVQRGPALVTTEAIGVQHLIAGASPSDAHLPHAREARSITVRCDDGTVREIAAAARDRDLLSTPFDLSSRA